MSVSFPASAKAQTEHMGSDRDSFSASIFESLGAPQSDTQPQQLSSSNLDLARSASSQPTTVEAAAKPRITKRINARLQLAAALVEADNEKILERAEAWPQERSASSAAEGLRPPPPPEPKLASHSAIFAPFREGGAPTHNRTISNASRLTAANNERRPSIDFLGVALPSETRTRSRAGSRMSHDTRRMSILSTGSAVIEPGKVVEGADQPGSRPASAMGLASEAGADDEALSAWGVDKFLSKDARERIAVEKRSRANSVAELASSRQFGGASSDVGVGRKSVDFDTRPNAQTIPRADPGASSGAGRARSEIIAATGAASSLDSRAALMARIKLYRERQENLPPSEWSGPGPTATKDEVVDHLLATAAPPTAGQTALSDADAAPSASIGGSVLDRGRPTSRSGSLTSNHLVSPNAEALPAPASALAEFAGDNLDRDNIPTSKSFEKERTVNTRSSHRHLSIFGVTGDNWSDHEHDSDVGDASNSKAATGASDPAMSSLRAEIDGVAAAAAAPPSLQSGGGHQHQGPGQDFVFPPPGPRPSSFALATSDQLTAAFGRRKSAILQQMEGSALQDGEAENEDPPLDMAGIGSYSRSQSRRNSLMAGAMLPSTVGAVEQPTSPAFRPQQIPSRPGTPGTLFGSSRALPLDPFSGLPLDPGPYAAGFAAAAMFSTSPMLGTTGGGNLPPVSNDASGNHARPATLSTRQLQAMARSATFPEHLMGGGGFLSGQEGEDVDYALNEDPDFDGPILGPEGLADELASDNVNNASIQLGGGVPDLSSANWGKPKKRWFRMSRMSMLGGDRNSKTFDFTDGVAGDALVNKAESTDGMDGGDRDESNTILGADFDDLDQDDDDRPLGLRRDVSEAYANEPISDVFKGLRSGGTGKDEATDIDDVDDDFVSPPKKGPLKPRGLEARLPKTLIMPQPLQGTRMAPKIRLTDTGLENLRQSSIYVPDGFVLHDGKGLPPTRSLQVTSANGPRPLFASAGGDQRLEELVSDIKTVEVTRTLNVPAAAPRGIGRRAAVPTTALFRNQLVQHDEEKEGWGWEKGTRADEATLDGSDSDEEMPLADLKKRNRAAKRAAKKAAKQKRKRKQARRERRAKREQATKEGRPFSDFGVDELSPDEDLDLSDTTSGSEETEYETESESWNSEDEKRWLDENKPAGKLFGKSLLDVAEERTKTRKTKARFYGQAQLEEEEAFERNSGLNVPGGGTDDGASIAPSMAKSFRENPIGYNDTKERMQATFGTDTLWAREMAKRLEAEAKEKEEAEIRRLAEEEFQREEEARRQRKKEKRLFRMGKSSKAQQRKGAGPGGRSTATTDSPAQGSSVDDSKSSAQAGDSGSVSPIRSRTPINAPVLDLDLSLDGPGKSKKKGHRKNANSAAAAWFDQSSDEEEEESDTSSDDEMTRRREAMQRVRMSRQLTAVSGSNSLAAEMAKHGIDLGPASDDDESSDDNVPLVQIKKAAVDKRLSMAPSMQLNGQARIGNDDDDESSEEELTLAAIRARRQQASANLGKLDLDFSPSGSGARSPQPASSTSSPGRSQPSSLGRASGKSALPGSSSLSQELSSIWNLNGGKEGGATKAAARDESEDSDEDVPLGMRHPNGLSALQVPAAGSDDEDDRPLGAAHPQAAIIAEQAEMIRQLRAENEQAQAHARMSTISPGAWGGMGGMPSMMGGMGLPGFGGMMGMPMGMAGGGGAGGMMPMPAAPLAPPVLPPSSGMAYPGIHIDAASPATVTGYLPAVSGPGPMGVDPAMAAAAGVGVAGMSMPSPALGMGMGMMLDPKASTIHNWRTQVPPDATGGTPTPTGSGSAAASALNSPLSR